MKNIGDARKELKEARNNVKDILIMKKQFLSEEKKNKNLKKAIEKIDKVRNFLDGC